MENKKIKSTDLVIGTIFVLRKDFRAAPAGSEAILLLSGTGGYGFQIYELTDGHDLNGTLPPGTTSGYYFTSLGDINSFFIEKPLTTKVDFETVVLAEEKKIQVVHALKQIDNYKLIFDNWGFGKTFEKGRGVSMLFYGLPGTGKTLMAQAIASKLDYSLNIISTADIQSSQPGEAERNIRKYFKESKGQKHILLFDECDSLIFSRGSVGPILASQVNELLSQLERFDGVTIFTTNRLGTLDEAVNRRLSVKIQFLLPTVEERIKIWQRMFPEEAPLDPKINWKSLAKHKIAGGHIKNAVLRAAREASVQDMDDDKKIIKMEHLLAGVKHEVTSHEEFQKAKRAETNRGAAFYGPEMSEDNKITKGGDLKSVRKSVLEMRQTGVKQP